MRKLPAVVAKAGTLPGEETAREGFRRWETKNVSCSWGLSCVYSSKGLRNHDLSYCGRWLTTRESCYGTTWLARRLSLPRVVPEPLRHHHRQKQTRRFQLRLDAAMQAALGCDYCCRFALVIVYVVDPTLVIACCHKLARGTDWCDLFVSELPRKGLYEVILLVLPPSSYCTRPVVISRVSLCLGPRRV